MPEFTITLVRTIQESASVLVKARNLAEAATKGHKIAASEANELNWRYLATVMEATLDRVDPE